MRRVRESTLFRSCLLPVAGDKAKHEAPFWGHAQRGVSAFAKRPSSLSRVDVKLTGCGRRHAGRAELDCNPISGHADLDGGEWGSRYSLVSAFQSG